MKLLIITIIAAAVVLILIPFQNIIWDAILLASDKAHHLFLTIGAKMHGF